MRYRGMRDFHHDQPERVGVLITNLGTPSAPTPSALRRYLAEFLADPRVVEVPRLLWWLILHGIILRIRPRRSAKSYRSVWQPDGSPLLLHTLAQRDGLRELLAVRWGDDLLLECAMRYGEPALPDVIERMQQQGVRRLLVLPLYPQYCAATTASTFDAVAADFARRRWLPALRFVNQYHDFEPYIEALATQVEAHWSQHGQAEMLLLSYHGVPLRYLTNGDPYHCQCHATSRRLAARLGLPEGQFRTTFQSRFGREQWLTPYTDDTLKALPGEGVKRVQVFCPGFAADCLETLEEIAVENRDYFLAAGGEQFDYIAAVNASSAHLDALAQLIERELSGWAPPDHGVLATRLTQAQKMGADR